jgi:predicted metalloprotease
MMHRVPRSGIEHLAVALVLLTLVAACGQGSSSPTPAATLRTPAPASLQPSFTPDALTETIFKATGGRQPFGSDLDVTWRHILESVEIAGERPYQAPESVLGYRAGDIPDTACARGTSALQWHNYARYCRADQRIVYDEDWLRGLVAQTDDSAALAILGHEWAHHIQWLLDRNVEDIREELQADCLAGLYLESTSLLPHDSLGAEDAALLAAMTSFFKLGNEEYKASEWFAAQEHGSPIQRVMATSTGLGSYQRIDPVAGGGAEKGLPSCYGYLDYRTQDIAHIGPYAFVELPGRASSTMDGVYVMEPETRTGQAGSYILMTWLAALPQPGGATADQLRAIWNRSWPGIDATVPEATISASIHGGTGIAAAYQFLDAEGSNPQSGEFGLVSPADGKGGLLVLVFEKRLATDNADALRLVEEAIVTINQVMGRLCTPDESGNSSDPAFDPACSELQ